MLRLLRDLLADPGSPRTVIVVRSDTAAPPRQHEVRARRVLLGLGAVAAAVAVGVGALAVRAAARPGADELRATAEVSAARAVALQDSLEAQAEQVALLRALITGEAPPRPEERPPPGDDAAPAEPGRSESTAPRGRGGAVEVLSARPPPPPTGRAPRTAAAYAAGLQFPAPPPVDGVLSRGFDAEGGHFAVDYAATVGTPVRAVAGGFVVFADWTHDGGHTIAVQHPGGYLSVYKHNSRLLKRVGDRVRTQESIALSGDTGRITSGPHLHVELWRDGLAQNPAAFLLE